jgi:hypothetical protein
MALFIIVFIAEIIVAIGAYYIFCKLMKNKSVLILAIAASLIGLIAGWTAGYRATGSQVTYAYLSKTNEQSIQTRGVPISSEEETRLKEILFSQPQFEYILHKAAAIYALPAFIVVMIIMIFKSRREGNRIMNGPNLNDPKEYKKLSWPELYQKKDDQDIRPEHRSYAAAEIGRQMKRLTIIGIAVAAAIAVIVAAFPFIVNCIKRIL